MNPNDPKDDHAPLPPESQPHGTTQDQVLEMENEGQGQDHATKETPATRLTPPPNRPVTVATFRGTGVK